ncbi:MAG: aromatic ring-hydroxylating dioxygenase subunit alpha [Cyclobacteriaceae bacterium]|nr:aromatic ring-hydroxylating dioxygenase subunit alpha [Cyclobacteriaceae bacterium]UYN85867.1 MAG: aromatic ring-hydroxylating dioxygenase subunit alpha [Cyclobacteriaceae bacterium]
MKSLQVNPVIASAKTLSSEFYTSTHYYEASKEKIFSKTWHYIGHSGLVEKAGQLAPVTLLKSFMEEPLLLARDKEKLHCLSNVCTHRGAQLVNAPCQVHDIRCPYHGRRFQLNGKFLSMPEFKEVDNFPTESDNLANLPLFEMGTMLFTSLTKTFEPEPFFQEMLSRIGWLPLDKFIFKPELTKEYTVEAHWALYCENYLEGFHIPFVHASLNQVIDYGNYTTELFRYANLQLGIAKDGQLVFDLPSHSPDYGKNVGGYYFWVFPNMMFNFYPWGLSLNVVEPMAIDKTKVTFYTFIWDENKYNQGAGSDLNRVELEDEAVVESVQRGIRSRFYSHGRYSVKQEKGTHHFHRLIAEFMEA